MSLRTRVLALFLLLAVLPLLVLGGVEYFRSIRALETLIATQNARIATRVADAIETRGALLESDLLLLSENAETQRWLNARARGEGEEAAALAGRRFLDEAWSRLRSGYAGFQLLDSRGQMLYVAGGEGPGFDALPGTLDPVERPVRNLASGRPIGAVRLALIHGVHGAGGPAGHGFRQRGLRHDPGPADRARAVPPRHGCPLAARCRRVWLLDIDRALAEARRRRS